MQMTVIDGHPDPVMQGALLVLLLLGPLGYVAVSRWRAAVIPVVVAAGVCAWLRLPLLLEPLAYIQSHGRTAELRAWWLACAFELAALLWAVSWAGVAFSRQEPRATA